MDDDEYEYHGDAADDEKGKETVIHVDDGYPDPIDHAEDEEKKPDIVYEKQGKGGVMRISPTSNLRWLPLFFALPKELVAKRPAYLEIPRHMKLLMKDQKYVNMVLDGSFLEKNIKRSGRIRQETNSLLRTWTCTIQKGE